jgi:hypothetical protein
VEVGFSNLKARKKGLVLLKGVAREVGEYWLEPATELLLRKQGPRP